MDELVESLSLRSQLIATPLPYLVSCVSLCRCEQAPRAPRSGGVRPVSALSQYLDCVCPLSILGLLADVVIYLEGVLVENEPIQIHILTPQYPREILTPLPDQEGVSPTHRPPLHNDTHDTYCTRSGKPLPVSCSLSSPLLVCFLLAI